MADRVRSWVHGYSHEANEAWNEALAWKNAVLKAEDAGVPAPARPDEAFRTLERETRR